MKLTIRYELDGWIREKSMDATLKKAKAFASFLYDRKGAMEIQILDENGKVIHSRVKGGINAQASMQYVSSD